MTLLETSATLLTFQAPSYRLTTSGILVWTMRDYGQATIHNNGVNNNEG
jgi:hypothetical protein